MLIRSKNLKISLIKMMPIFLMDLDTQTDGGQIPDYRRKTRRQTSTSIRKHISASMKT